MNRLCAAAFGYLETYDGESFSPVAWRGVPAGYAEYLPRRDRREASQSYAQIVGGAAQGIGGSLLEELAYDAAGQLLTASFMDYLLPTAMDMPRRVEVLLREDAPSPLNPLGLKGAGEGGVVGCPAAIANAVVDALGAEVYELPLTPERVRALARRTGGGHARAPAI